MQSYSSGNAAVYRFVPALFTSASSAEMRSSKTCALFDAKRPTFTQYLENTPASKLPNSSDNTGVSNSFNIVYSSRTGAFSNVPRASTNRYTSNPNQMAAPMRVTKQSRNQRLGTRNRGQTHTAAIKLGTTIANQIKCAETNALVGGSQPTPAKMCHNRGMGSLITRLDAKTSPPTNRTLTINLRTTTSVVLQFVHFLRFRIVDEVERVNRKSRVQPVAGLFRRVFSPCCAPRSDLSVATAFSSSARARMRLEHLGTSHNSRSWSNWPHGSFKRTTGSFSMLPGNQCRMTGSPSSNTAPPGHRFQVSRSPLVFRTSPQVNRICTYIACKARQRKHHTMRNSGHCGCNGNRPPAQFALSKCAECPAPL